MFYIDTHNKKLWLGPLDNWEFAPFVLDKSGLLNSRCSSLLSTQRLKLCTSAFSDFNIDFKDCRLCETGTTAGGVIACSL